MERASQPGAITRKLLLAATSLAVTDPLEFVDIAASAGFDGIGLRLYHATNGPMPITQDASLRQQVRAKLQDTGLELLDVFSCYLRENADFDGLKSALACGAELGATYALAICADTDWSRSVEYLGRLCTLASEYGLVPAVEAPLHGRIIGTLDRTLQLVDEAGGDAVMCLDTYQIFRTGDKLDAVQHRPEKFPYAQLADGFAAPVQTRVPGEGAAPLAEILSAMPGDLPLSVECVPDVSVDPRVWARSLLDATRRVLTSG